MPPTFGSFFAAAGKFEKSSAPTMRSPAPTAKIISVRFGASVTTRLISRGIATERPRSSVAVGAGRSRHAKTSAQNKTAAEAAVVECEREALAFTAVFVVQVVGDAEAVAGG